MEKFIQIKKQDENETYTKLTKEEKIRTIYSQEEVNYWIKLYEIFGNLSKVSREYEESTKKRVPENTIKRRIKELQGESFSVWYNKYKLMGKYSWEDAREWKELYEEFHDFTKVVEFYEENVNLNCPHVDTIRKYVKKYIHKILLGDYDAWITEFHEDRPYRYNKENYAYWKILYEELGSLKDVRSQLMKENDNTPDPLTIRNGLRDLIGEQYESWKNQYAKQNFSRADIKEWKKLYEKYGSIGKVSKITGNDPKIITKYLKTYFGEKYDIWYKKFYKHHSLKYSDLNINEWKLLFEELGSFPAVSQKIKVSYGTTINPSVIRKTVKQFLTKNGKNYNKWLNKYSLSENLVDIGKKIHQIIEYYFMLNFKDTSNYTFYEITPTIETDDLFRIDNLIIYSAEEINKPFDFNIISIDYLFSSNPERAYPKMYKHYHGKDMFILIVTLTDTIENYFIPLDVPYKQNIKIIDIKDFFNLFSFKKEIKEKIESAIKMAKESIYSQSKYVDLQNLAKKLNQQLKNDFGNRITQQKNYSRVIKTLQS